MEILFMVYNLPQFSKWCLLSSSAQPKFLKSFLSTLSFIPHPVCLGNHMSSTLYAYPEWATNSHISLLAFWPKWASFLPGTPAIAVSCLLASTLTFLQTVSDIATTKIFENTSQIFASLFHPYNYLHFPEYNPTFYHRLQNTTQSATFLPVWPHLIPSPHTASLICLLTVP